MQASHKNTLKQRQKNMFTSYFNENKCDGASLLSLFDNVYFIFGIVFIWIVKDVYTVDLPNFEHVPYFEHHVNKGFS